MFGSVGWGEMSMLLVVVLFVVGPDRLPAVAADAARTLRRARRRLTRVGTDLEHELGPELGDLVGSLRDLRPRSVAAALWTDETDETTGPRTGPEPFAERSPARREDPAEPARSPRP